MVRVRTANDIVLSILDFYRTAIPNLDLKPGQVARDILVDGPAVQLARLYEELLRVQDSQSLFMSLGSELNAIASNYGATRKQGSRASGVALLTFNEIESDIPINKGSVVVASNGASFTVNTSLTVGVANKNTYRATAQKYRGALDFVGIDDQYAVEVSVNATSTGSGGNISRYSLTSTTIAGVSRVTNPASFAGGSPAETDSAFKRRVLGIFSGANTGTETGYRNVVMSDPDVVDAIVVGPGDPLMTRDGTQVYVAEDRTRTITSEGTGGKVDIYAYGFRLAEILDSFIYYDKSNRDDPTDIVNDYVLGQIDGDENKLVVTKRKENLENQELPNQPVTNILEVSGSSSGSHFIEKSTDDLGRVSGNYELVYDDGVYAGSPWGFDRLRWVDDRVRDLPEDLTKGKFNSQDSTGFSDVTKIGAIKQNIQVVNENSRVSSSDRSSIYLSHYPVTAVSRIFNQTTGERYIISSQNPDGGTQNTTGRITITGSTLPAVSDILQVDYIWLFDYDPYWDFDNRVNSDNIRDVVDSIDWGYSNDVRREEVIVQGTGTQQRTIEVTHPVNAVVSVNTFKEDTDIEVTLVSNRIAIVASTQIVNVISVVDTTSGAEYYNTGRDDGSFSGATIYLPTDTSAEVGDIVNVRYNVEDKFTTSGVSGSFSTNVITLPAQTNIGDGYIVEVNYLADIRQLVPATTLANFPIYRNANGFQNADSTLFGTQPTTHIYYPVISIVPDLTPPIQRNLRRAPSRLKMTIAGTISPGVLTVSGTSITGIFDGVFTATANGQVHDLSSLIRKALKLTSNQSIPNNVGIISLIAFDKVQAQGQEVIAVEQQYDVFGYEILNNNFSKEEALENTSLTRTQIKIPKTITNEDNLPVIGEKFRVTFYVGTTDDSENVSFSKSGTLYTQKTFAFVDIVSISSGFTSGSSQSATLTIAPQNQPTQGSRYTSYYDYLAPKQNERITIRYNKNQVISDNTFSIERTRPIGSDVLVKSAIPIRINITLAIVVEKGYETSSSVVAQNVQDAVTQSLNAAKLGTTIDESDSLIIAGAIAGVGRVRSTHFNRDGEVGRVLSIEAQKNEYIIANDVVVIVEER
jgi:hypothetical protein